MADYNLWIWHAYTGDIGAMKDTTIWESSPSYHKFVHGVWDGDFKFKIGNDIFKQMYILVDGIYPLLFRFFKTLPIPLTIKEKLLLWIAGVFPKGCQAYLWCTVENKSHPCEYLQVLAQGRHEYGDHPLHCALQYDG